MEESNPYDFVNPVRDPRNFAGRAGELKEIEYYLDLSKAKRPQFFHLALIGARGSGKTSLWNVVSDKASQKGLLPIKISLDNEIVSNDVLFFKEVYDAILTQGQQKGLFRGFYHRFRKIVDRLDGSITIPLLFGEAYLGWKKGSGATIPQSVIVHDLRKLSSEARTKGFPTVVLLFDECDLLSKNETLLQKIRNAFQELEGYILVFSGTDAMFPALDKVFSPIPRFFKRISVENFKNYEETKDCVLRPLIEEEKKLVDEASIFEIHYFTAGSPYEVNLVSHFMYKSWKQDGGPKMALSVKVLDDVLEELERLRKAEHHKIANQVKTFWPETIRVLTSALEFPNVKEDWLVQYNLLSRLASTPLKDLPAQRSAIEQAIISLKEQDIIREDESKSLSFNGDQFDTLYLKYTALSKGITDFFVGMLGEPINNLWMKMQGLLFQGFAEYQVHTKFDKSQYIKGLGRNARMMIVGAKASLPPGPPKEHLIMSFTLDELERKFYLGTANSLRFRVNAVFMQDGFVCQATFKKPEDAEQLKSKLSSLDEKLDYVGLSVLFEDEIYWNNEANRLIDKGQLDEATQALGRAIKINPTFELPWINLARVALLQRDPEKVVEFGTKATELSPGNWKAWELKGVGLLNQGRNEEALNDLDRSVELAPEEFTPWDNRGRALLNLHRFEEAGDSFQKALKHSQNNSEAMGLLGVAFAGMRDFDQSNLLLDKALEQDPNQINFMIQKSMNFAKSGKPTEAREVANSILDIDPACIEALTIKARVSYDLGKYTDAIETSEKILRLHPNDSNALYNKACYECKSGFLDESIASLKKAIELNATYSGIANSEGDFDLLRSDPRFVALTGLKKEIKLAA